MCGGSSMAILLRVHQRRRPARPGRLRSLARALAPALTSLVGALPALGAPAPQLVPQIAHAVPVSATLWSLDGRYLYSLDTHATLVIWDVAAGAILQRLKFPCANTPHATVRHFGWSGDGRLLSFELDTDPDLPAPLAAAAGHPGEPWPCVQGFDPRTGEERSVAPALWPPGQDGSTEALFGVSPDGRTRALADHGTAGDWDPRASGAPRRAACVPTAACAYGVQLVDVARGGVRRALTGGVRAELIDAALTRDGARLVLLESAPRPGTTHVAVLEPGAGRSRSLTVAGSYDAAIWLDDARALLMPALEAGLPTRDDGAPDALILTPECLQAGRAEACTRLPARAMMRPLASSGTFVGVAAGRPRACSVQAGGRPCASGPGGDVGGRLEMYAPVSTGGARWRPVALPADWMVTALDASWDGTRIALAAVRRGQSGPESVVATWSGAPDDPPRILWSSAPSPATDASEWDGPVHTLSYSEGGDALVFSSGAQVVVLDPTGRVPPRAFAAPALASTASPLALDGNSLLKVATGRLQRLDTGETLRLAFPKAVSRLLRGGFLGAGTVAWAAGNDGEIHFWDVKTGEALLTLAVLPGDHFLAVAQNSTYDTDTGPDSAAVRWLLARADGAPTDSLPAQTFMRDYYTPNLLPRLLACTALARCATALPAVPPIGAVNRLLPLVTVDTVSVGPEPGTASVCVSAHETAQWTPLEGVLRSGLQDLRLFRDGRLVAERGAAPAGLEPTDLPAWRRTTSIPAQSCAAGAVPFMIAVPSAGAPVRFSAYAFNADRVKGATSAEVTYPARAARPRREPRAYVVAIGIDTYPNASWKNLKFAVSDARAMVHALDRLPGYRVVPVTLTASRDSIQATKEALHAAFALLGGQDVEANRARLQALGVAAAGLSPANPDDALIVSFSGHGHTDRSGRFYLLPADTRVGDDGLSPVPDSAVSAAELADWLRGVDAGEIALVIDACHSAASVEAGDFKPGPMGDPGLGQLAYDKGIRILAASHAVDVALEDDRLRHGLLSFALTDARQALQGVGDSRAGGLRLDAWLRRGASLVPQLSLAARGAGRSAMASADIVFDDDNAAALPPQEPTVFDFTSTESPVVLVGSGP